MVETVSGNLVGGEEYEFRRRIEFKLLELRWRTGVKITEHAVNDTNKMAGKFSISTSCLENQRCIARMQVPETVCEKCFAAAQLEYRKAAGKCYRENFAALTAKEIPVEQWPDLCGLKDFRIEAYGDVANTIQVRNYYNFAKRNPETQFVAWTKNPDLYAAVAGEKPANFRIIYSIPELNPIPGAGKEVFEKYGDILDKTFEVWESKEKAQMSGKEISCRKRCQGCPVNCYGAKNHCSAVVEILK